MNPPLEQDLEALVAELSDKQEAEALQLLMEVATQTPWEPKVEVEYKPFVYPH